MTILAADPGWQGGYVTMEALADTATAAAPQRLAVVMSGGGASGAYEAGALEALLAHGLIPDLVAGTSVGALIAYAHVIQRLVQPAAPHLPESSAQTQFWWQVSHDSEGAEAVVDKPVLLDAATGRGISFTRLGGQLAALLQGEMRLGIFKDAPLRKTITNLTQQTLDASPVQLDSTTLDAAAMETLARRVVKTWLEARHAGEAVPELLFCGTNLTLEREALFCLLDPVHLHALAQADWWTFDLSGRTSDDDLLRYPSLCALSPESLFEALLISTSIPGIFPAHHLRFRRAVDGVIREHDHLFTDGGVAMNSPLRAAADVGATTVVSLETAPLHRDVTLVDPRVGTAAEAGSASFFAVLGIGIQHSLEAISQLNAMSLSAQRAQPPVQVYRLGPIREGLGIIDFAGHYEHGERTWTLFDWFMQGYFDAAGPSHSDDPLVRLYEVGVARGDDEGLPTRRPLAHPGFWRASLQVSPTHQPLPQADLTGRAR